ncbi:hypothetical protein N658DRAFT_500907 [Parathielavia hyrcaniae]|uniref:Uncharacterized protein n=1 Tax=Parathielavia hyrcaniae TaxID=113614 RepID=A0AAN6SXJ1_9PEZI|nr:hypothetical protein N658DRAFT_500907 [Parathielavia hyrcaniae]
MSHNRVHILLHATITATRSCLDHTSTFPFHFIEVCRSLICIPSVLASTHKPSNMSQPKPQPQRTSSVYSQGSSLASTGSNPPPCSLPSSGYSPAANRPGSSGSSGPGSGPAPPGHADIMSLYGHSSYGADSQSGASGRGSGSVGAGSPAGPATSSIQTFIQSAPQTLSARGASSAPGPPGSASGTDYSRTYVSSTPQVGPARGPHPRPPRTGPARTRTTAQSSPTSPLAIWSCSANAGRCRRKTGPPERRVATARARSAKAGALLLLHLGLGQQSRA